MSEIPTIGIYHRADLDGQCCAAICKKAIPDVQLIGWDYGDPIPWDDIRGNDVFMMDISFQPWPEMEKLLDCAYSVTWIDHHKSAMEEREANGDPWILGFRKTDEAACELCWRYFFPEETMPRGVFLLGDYDCWRHSSRDSMAYNMGLKLSDMDPVSNPESLEDWEAIFEDGACLRDLILRTGHTVLEYQNQQNAKAANRLWFKVAFGGHMWMAVNQGGINSQFWDSVWIDEYDGKLSFVWVPHHWTVSLYSDTIDCSEIAKQHRGGGHKGAAGFQCATLPFNLGPDQPVQPLI